MSGSSANSRIVGERPERLGAPGELGEDLLIRVAPPDARLERAQLGGIDRRDAWMLTLARHRNQW